MYKNKKDVDKYVESLNSKLSAKELKTRAFSIARLYFDVGDYNNCQRFVEQYLTQKTNNAAAYKLLGHALQKLEQKDKALDNYKTSLDIDPTQTSLILDICDILADEQTPVDPGRARYWYEKAEATFPRHPVTFRLCEKLVSLTNPDPEAVLKLLLDQLELRPKDVLLHINLVKHYLENNKIKEAMAHICAVEFSENPFLNNYCWYEIVSDTLKNSTQNMMDWQYQLLLLTVSERICYLSLTEIPSGSSKSLVESNELLHKYDQDIYKVMNTETASNCLEFHASLLNHHKGQFALHAATYLLKKAKKDQMSWRDATRFGTPFMLIASQTKSLDLKANWVKQITGNQQNVLNRWSSEQAYRYSQSGHYLLTNIEDRQQSVLDQTSQLCSGTHWRDKLYEKIFTSRNQSLKINLSYLASNHFIPPQLQLPERTVLEVFDNDAQNVYANSLHHFVWTLLHYKQYASFNCDFFSMLRPKVYNYSNCGPETLNKVDIYAFLYSTALTTQQQKANLTHIPLDKPNVLPANISDLLCTAVQMKWWDCAYKYSQNELGSELTDIRSTLSRGIEVVRCIDYHGLDPELLCLLARIFCDKAQATLAMDEKNDLEARANLYYNSAIPLLEKLKNKIVIKLPGKKLFDYTSNELTIKDINSLLLESKLYVAIRYLHDGEYERVVEMLSKLKTPESYYYLSSTYKKMAEEEDIQDLSNSEAKSKYSNLMHRAKHFAYKAIDLLKDKETSKNHCLYTQTQELIEDIETCINKTNTNLSSDVTNNNGRYSSDEHTLGGIENHPMRIDRSVFRNLSSTPKQSSNTTGYRTAVDLQMHENTGFDHHYFDRIEEQIKNLQKRDSTINDFMDQTKDWFEENKKLGNKIINTINTNIQNTTDQFKSLKISVDQVKDQIEDCRKECKDVGELKQQIAELKVEVNRLKHTSSEHTKDENEVMYNSEEGYRTTENSSSFTPQIPFTPPQVLPPFNTRFVPPSFPVPPNPYHLYGQNLFNLYNHYSQLIQPPQVPGAPPLFDATRSQINYPGVYPTPDQMYLDVANLVPPTVPPTPVAPVLPAVSVPLVSIPPTGSVSQNLSVITSKSTTTSDTKDSRLGLPVNVVITSSDPLPTCTTAPQPILSVTIPSKHIKNNTPHNYQIPMPSANENKIEPPSQYTYPGYGKLSSQNVIQPPSWGNSSHQFIANSTTSLPISYKSSLPFSNITQSDNSTSVVDGVCHESSIDISLDKSRTLSEKSNTSLDNYDPCPDFKPIIPLPAEVIVKTGEEEETVVFSARAKLYRFVDKQWKERGLGKIKLLRHNVSGKVRVLMRREQIHKICANHIITSEMTIEPMKNENKAYFWVANDFADEKLVLEKFCIRFKTSEIAQEFYSTFEKARQECEQNNSTKSIDSSLTEAQNISTSKIETLTKPVESTVKSSSKSTIGGFTFTSTPTFKDTNKIKDNEIKLATPVTTQSNIFSNFSFKSTTASPFSNLFSTTNTNQITNDSISNQVTNKLDTSDTLEEFESTAEFQPIIPLPALVDHKTGEEDEIILFEHRAKLLRYDAAGKEWKERGLGNIKLLVHKENMVKVRLLMRREQVMKVCCNHAVTKEMIFEKMPNVDKAVTWCAKDFSEGKLVSETFCMRFKTADACNSFIEAVQMAQSKMGDQSKAAKEEQNAAKQNQPASFGDKFKPKSGSWYCETCYTNNLENFNKCACCEQLKPQENKVDNSNEILSNWEKYKVNPDTWECKECFVRNDNATEICSACSSPKEMVGKPLNKNIVETGKYNYGISTQVLNQASLINTSGWGDKFKPKEGTWECIQCFVRNESNIDQCSACSVPKDGNSAKKDNNKLLQNTVAGTKFNFGIPSNSKEEKPKTETTTSIFDGTGVHKFSFGMPSTVLDKASSDPKPLQYSIFGNNPNYDPVNFSSKSNNFSKDSGNLKPALLPTPQGDSATMKTLGGKESGTFDFVFKPKSPIKGKSPLKSPKVDNGDESDGNEYASEDEGSHIHFSPVIPLPDKVEVVTGEENEDELYGHRAKLYRFLSGEWKERGIGLVKILRHKETGKLRVLMRREQVLKICLNHALSSEITYMSKDDKSWLFTANDYSDGDLKLQQFCLRFKTKEIALEFKNAIDKALCGFQIHDLVKKDLEYNNEVVFVKEIQATDEEKQKAKDLLLPENFYTYKNKEPCKGCRGCEDDSKTDFTSVNQAVKSINTITSTSAQLPLNSTPEFLSLSTPLKSTTVNSSTFWSPMNSIYGTPTALSTTNNTSIFCTPLDSTVSSNNTTLTPSQTNLHQDNSVIKKPILAFSGLNENNKLETPEKNTPNIFKMDQSKGTIVLKDSVFGGPKSEEKQSDIKSVFNPSKPSQLIFSNTESILGNTASGESINKSVFSFSLDNKSLTRDQTPEKLFGRGASDNGSNLFSSSIQSNVFLPANSQRKEASEIFGTVGNVTQHLDSKHIFGSGTSIFGNSANVSSKWLFGDNQAKAVGTNESKSAEKKGSEEKEVAAKVNNDDPPLNLSNSLTFAALSSSEPGFKKNIDFRWEGAGQQLFTVKTTGKDTSQTDTKNESNDAVENTSTADDEYDPHYEPIVPLPEKIVVTTGEEDEEKLFADRCKLYRYNDSSREWKERGVGEIKILYHPLKKTYRLLLRREQVYKAVLNMLLVMDLELLPMKNSDRAWTWAGRNYAENNAGEQETLAVRFKTVQLANAFRDKIVECVRKLQAAAAEAIREAEDKNSNVVEKVAPLRLPKHLETSARADISSSTNLILSEQGMLLNNIKKDNSQSNITVDVTDSKKQLVELEQPHDEDEDDYVHEYDDIANEEYDAYYQDDEEESEAYYSGEVLITQGTSQTSCPEAHVQVMYDQEIHSPKIMVVDNSTGEVIVDMLIHTETEFQMSEHSCTWSGTDYTRNNPAEKTVTVTFSDNDMAVRFYDTCETSKSHAYSSTDPDS